MTTGASQMTIDQLLDVASAGETERRVFFVARRNQGAMEYVMYWGNYGLHYPRYTTDTCKAVAYLWIEAARRMRDQCGAGHVVVDENGEEVS